MNRPSSRFGILFLGTEPRRTWQIADPTDKDSLEAYGQVRGAAYAEPLNPPSGATVTVDRRQLQRVLGLAEAYLHLGTYEIGTTHVLKQLREVRRVLRELGRAR